MKYGIYKTILTRYAKSLPSNRLSDAAVKLEGAK
jgi:hypothetical protein